MKRTRINFAIKSTKGKRPVNQDSLVCTYNYNSDFIAIVCDGIGSVKHSEAASKLMCQIFATEFEKQRKIEKPIIWAKETLEKALNRLKYISLANNTIGISTTIAILMVVDNKYYALNIGDTRIFDIAKDKTVKQLTVDHNYYNFLLKKKTSEKVLEANKTKWFSLTRYIDGSKPDKAKFDYAYGDTSEFRYFVICTDGLYNFIKKEKMVKIANAKVLPLAVRSGWMNRNALNNNSHDNVSNILVSCAVHGK